MTSLGWSDPTFQRQRGGERMKKMSGGAVGFIDCHIKLRTNEMEMEKEKYLQGHLRGL